LRFRAGSGIFAAVSDEPDKIGPLKCVRLLDTFSDLIDKHVPDDPDTHGNRQLHLSDTLRVLMAAFFNPTARSLRLIELLSQKQRINERLGVRRVARSTLSDALAQFDPERIRPLIAHLRQQLPALQRIDRDLESITRQLIAADGSYFNLAGDVTWAMSCRRGNNPDHTQSRVRLNLQLNIDSLLPIDCDVSGAGDGSEAAAFMRRIHKDAVYIVDRNFNHFGFLRAVLEKGSSVVVRLRSDTHVEPLVDQPTRVLTGRDTELNIRTDRLVTLGTLLNTRHRRNGNPPTQTLREVVVWDEKNKTEIRLLTDILDVPAHVIGMLYQLRWQIELFLRWLKVFAAMEHLVSFSKNGVTIQFYVAVIACLLMYLNTGRRPGKYLLFEMQMIACGMSTPEEMSTSLARLDRERELAAARAKKKATEKALSKIEK